MGSDGVRAQRHGVVHRHQPGLAAGGGQTVGRRRPAETTGPARAAHQRRPGRAPPHRLPGAAVGVAADARRPRRTPGGAGTSRHGGVPAPAGLPRIGRADQRRRPDPGLPRGPRRAHPHPGDGADPPRRHRRRTGRGLRHRAGGRARRTRTGRTEPGPAAGNHAAAVRTPGSTDLTGDAHRRRAGHRHRPPPRRDLRPGLRLPDPRRRRAARADLRQPQGQPARTAPADQRADRRT